MTARFGADAIQFDLGSLDPLGSGARAVRRGNEDFALMGTDAGPRSSVTFKGGIVATVGFGVPLAERMDDLLIAPIEHIDVNISYREPMTLLLQAIVWHQVPVGGLIAHAAGFSRFGPAGNVLQNSAVRTQRDQSDWFHTYSSPAQLTSIALVRLWMPTEISASRAILLGGISVSLQFSVANSIAEDAGLRAVMVSGGSVVRVGESG